MVEELTRKELLEDALSEARHCSYLDTIQEFKKDYFSRLDAHSLSGSLDFVERLAVRNGLSNIVEDVEYTVKLTETDHEGFEEARESIELSQSGYQEIVDEYDLNIDVKIKFQGLRDRVDMEEELCQEELPEYFTKFMETLGDNE